ncbi:HAD family hydrolase [Salipaludibacillus sp. HK11]|uniref:HAD family hydrolase n=1 Tax=Salipaludibacillus sp. HK11 TaxID=3394320 RepID=UPI0039FBC0D8
METIIFDVDDTLYDQVLPFKNAFRKLVDEPFTDEEIEEIYIESRKHSDALFDKNLAGEVSLEEMHKYRVTAAFKKFNIEVNDEKAIAFQATYLAEQQKITLYEEVEQLLDFLLAENKQLAVLTNGEEGHQSMKIRQLNLARWIPAEHIFISGSVGHAKPTKEVFQIIENKLLLNKTKTVYIGDSFENDIVGAKQAGWQAIWMNHRNRNAPVTVPTVKPDKVVYTAKELLYLFK